MIVRCANCQTEFSLDDRRVAPEGAPVRCSVCGYVFRVDAPTGVSSDRPWQIRTAEELLFTAPDLKTLRAWIGEGRLHPDDHVSRTGQQWVRLGDMSEFADAFAEFQALPRVVEPALPPSERSAAEELGPPPAFGTGASESSGPTAGAVSAPLMESHTEQLRVAIESEGVPKSPLSHTASEGIVVGDVGHVRSGESSAPKPASMLDVVSRNVQPIPASSRAAEVAEPVDRVRDPDPVESLSETLPRAQPAAEPVADALELEPRKRSAWPLVGGLGLLVAAAAVFGIPDLRERLLGAVSGGESADPPVTAPLELPSVVAALEVADPLAIGKAEAELQARIDEGGESPSHVAAMQLAQVELLTTRSLSSTIVAALDEKAEREAKNAADDAARAAGIFEQVDSAHVVERDRIRTARARLRLVEGRPAEEILALLPEGAEELRHVVTGAPLWRDADARVPEGVIGGLEGLTQPSVTGQLVLALAYLRSGDRSAAERTVDAVLQRSPAQPAALALQAVVQGEGAGTDPDEKPKLVADADAAKNSEVGDGATAAKQDGAPKASTPKTTSKGSAGGGGAAGGSVDRLIDQGCDLVESGKASAGIELLKSAEQRRPSDLDVLVCLGLGYSKQGQHSNALRYFERALARNPGYGAALRGAARAAKSSGKTAKAVEYYQRVLKAEPRNAEARAYVDAHTGG